MTKYWMAVASREHVMRGVTEGFAQVCHGKGGPLKKMSEGDWIIYYSPTEKFGKAISCRQFTAIGKIEKGKPYLFAMSDDFIPWRRKVHFFPAKEVDIGQLLDKLSFIQDKRHWGFIFRRGFFEISETDFKIIADNMGALIHDKTT